MKHDLLDFLLLIYLFWNFHQYKCKTFFYSTEKQLKEKFANDPENLVITNRKYNRQKGAKTIAQWLPINFSYACKYYKDWIKIKKKYDLPISKAELNALDPALCP